MFATKWAYFFKNRKINTYMVADLGKPPSPKFPYFHAVFGQNGPNIRLSFPLGNPGSATGAIYFFCLLIIALTK